MTERSSRAARRGGRALAVLLLVAGAALAAPPAEATDPTCPAAPVPQIRVEIAEQDVAYDRSRTAAELRALDANAAPEWLRGRGNLLGFTQHLIGLDFGKLTAITAQAEGGLCVGFRDGTLTLEIATTIHVASEIPAGSCLDREMIAHEWKHHELGLKLIAAHARELEARFAVALAEQPFVFTPSANVAGVAIGRLREIMDPAGQDFDEVYPREELTLDTAAEYQRILDACPGEQQRLLDR